MKKVFMVVFAAALTLTVGVRPSSSAFNPLSTGYGFYDTVQFTNNTHYCVWLTIYEASGTFNAWKQDNAQNVTPGKIIVWHYLNVPQTKLLAEMWSQQNCTGPKVGSRDITKTATQPADPNQTIHFAAYAQLDYGGGANFNLYWGQDKVLSSSG